MAIDGKDIRWETYDSPHKQRNTDWFWGVGFVTILLVATAIYLNNVLFAILIVIGVIVALIGSLREPRLESYALTQKGVVIEGALHSYSTLNSFWIIENDYFPHILIEAHNMSRLLVIPLADIDRDIARTYLFRYINERELQEPTSQKIMELLGF